MSDIIGRLLDEAEKAQRKGHLVLAEVCRDASDQLGLVMDERDRLLESVELLDALWHEYHDACVSQLEENDRLRQALERAADTLSDASLLDAWADARAALKETGHE
jgi:hypothetical protein